MKKAMYREIYNQPIKLDIVIYAERLYLIGGIESWLYYVCKRYNIGQITVMYRKAEPGQLTRLKDVVDLVQYTGQEFECNKIIFVAPIYIDEELYKNAKQRYLINHCNYGNADNTEVFEVPEMDGIFAVSDVCAESCKKRMLGDIVTLYNPVEIKAPKKVLRLISACRWHKNKGSEQMLKFADMLDKAGIPFMWFIFTDTEPEEHHQNMYFLPPRYDLASVMAGCDYRSTIYSNRIIWTIPCRMLKMWYTCNTYRLTSI